MNCHFANGRKLSVSTDSPRARYIGNKHTAVCTKQATGSKDKHEDCLVPGGFCHLRADASPQPSGFSNVLARRKLGRR